MMGSPPFQTGNVIRCRDEASLNIIIPMGGSGEAFKTAGFTQPKPMIKVAGRPLLHHLLDSLRLRLGDVVWLIIPSSVYMQFQSQLDFKAEYPQADIRVCEFTVLTRGAIETIFIGLQQMTSAELSRRALVLDCDNLYFADVLSMFRAAPSGKGMCAYFIDRGTAALYSYLRLGADGLVTEVREKNAISELANIGAYGFASGHLLRNYSQRVLDTPQGGRNQYFVSNVINQMITDGHGFVANLAEGCEQCGTPEKLEQFMAKVSRGEALTLPKRRFCFALDNVLVTPPERTGDFTSVRPIEKNVQLVRELHAAGHHIIITTSRLMQECGGNVGAVVAACGNQTLRVLESLNIPFDEIHFGQPFAHVYVDASVACSALNTEKDLGWKLKGQAEELTPGMVAARHFNNVQLDGDYVIKTASRSVLRGEIFFYEHMPADIAHLFPALVSSFSAGAPRSPAHPASPRGESTPTTAVAAASSPRARAISGDEIDVSDARNTSLTAPLVNPSDPPGHAADAKPKDAESSGIDHRAFERAASLAERASARPAKLSTGGFSLQEDELDPTAAAAAAALGAPPGSLAPGTGIGAGGADAESVSSLTLQRIKGVTFSHLVTNRCLTPGRLVLLLKALRELHSSAGDQQTLIKLSEINICANYLPKLKKRYTQHEATYRALSTESEHMFRRVEADLRSYEQERRWQHANVIHGDPVFSNVLLTDDGKIYLLDMRGELGSHLTLQGDLTYDLSKVYQSLLGYDYIILSQPLHERDAELLEELRRTFRTFVREHYPTVRFSDVVKLTASHYFGIVPLHVNRDHQCAYLQTASALISSLEMVGDSD